MSCQCVLGSDGVGGKGHVAETAGSLPAKSLAMNVRGGLACLSNDSGGIISIPVAIKGIARECRRTRGDRKAIVFGSPQVGHEATER